MPDRLYLSFWLKRYGLKEVLAAMTTAVESFPYSATRPGVREVSVHPVDWSEPAAIEQEYREGADPAHALHAIDEFSHADCAFKTVVFWDLEGGPVRAEIIAYGPEFEGREEERGHLEIDLGLETPFVSSQVNVSKLIALARNLTVKLPVRKRRLWTESGEDFADHILERQNRG